MTSGMAETTYERRIVSVLFADLVGFTPLSERLEPEDVAAIQDRYFAAVREAVGHYLGVLEKFVGDAAMAAFGVPVGRDDDAERAARCGLAIVAAVERLDAELGLETGIVSVRVGIATGEVVHAESGPDAGRLTGDTVNTAARLQTVAAPGQVLLSEATALGVAEAIELGPPIELELKGKTSPVRARAALGALAGRSREAAMGALHAPILGRDPELDLLTAALAKTNAEGSAERWLVVAPPGTGKTRLLGELAARAATGVVQRRARFRGDDPRPFGAISDLASALVADDIATRLVAGGLAPGRASVVGEAFTRLAAGAVAESRTSLDRVARFAAWLDGFAALASADGELWLIEDAHWAGRDALAFLDAAETRPGPGGRLVVVTARPSLLETDPSWSATDAAEGRYRIDLPGLGGGPSLELIHALVGDAIEDGLATRIVDASDGNCLFIEELLRTWISVGILRRDGPRWRMDAPAEQVTVPVSVHAVYGAQLDDLPPSARSVARRAAVAGRRFPIDALADLGVADPADALDSLARRALIAGPADLPVVGAGYAYRHALLRDAAYASLARAERAALHVALARWLEAAAGARVDEVAESIGDHYQAALASAPSLAEDVAPGIDRPTAAALAAGWLERAADRALGEAATDAAVVLMRRAIELTPPEALLDAGRRRLGLGAMLRRSGEADQAVAALQLAIDDARSALTSPGPLDRATARTTLARAGAALSRLYFEQLRFVDAWHLADGILAEIGPADDVESARLILARASGRGGETNDAGPWIADARTALEIARVAGDRPLELAALRELAYGLDEAGLATVDDLRAVSTLARDLGDWDAAAAAMIAESGFLLTERPADVRAALRPAREIAETWLLPERLGWVLQRTCEADFAAGEWEEGMAAGIEAFELGLANGFHRIAVRSLTPLLVMAGWRGEADLVARGRRWFEEAEGRRTLPDSPYARVLFANASIWFGRFGLIPPTPPDPDRLGEGLAQDPSSPAWLGCLTTIFGVWRSVGWLEPCREALAAATTALDRSSVASSLARGALAVEQAAVEQASGADPARVEAVVRGGIPTLRQVGAGWWMLRGLRLLEGLDRASSAEQTERRALERRLGLPTNGPGVD